MTKKTERVQPTALHVKPEHEEVARALIASAMVNEHELEVDTHPETPPVVTLPVDAPVDELTLIYQQAYADALTAGQLEGDARASATRKARRWAREHNRRMPESF